MIRVPLVNTADEIVGYKTRDELLSSDLHRITAIWITSPTGKILMAKRSALKRKEPNKWALAASGTVEEHETYDSNSKKELEEELGISGVTLALGPKMLFTGLTPRWCQFYICTIPDSTPLHLQEEEVAETKWFSRDELQEFYRESPSEFTVNAAVWLPKLLSEYP